MITYCTRLLLCAAALFAVGPTARAQWTDLSTGIDDDLHGVFFWGDNGTVCGDHGIYITHTGGVGAASWTHLSLPGTVGQRYERTHFTGVAGKESTPNVAYFCGRDTVDDAGVVLRLDIATSLASWCYIGPSGTSLNAICFSGASFSSICAVGDSGLLVRSTDLTTFDPVTLNTVDELLSISSDNYRVVIGGVNVLVLAIDASTFTSSVFEQPGEVLYGVKARLGDSHNYGVGLALYSYTGSTSPSGAPSTQFSPYSLDGRAISGTTTGTWVATGHGMYKGGAPNPNYLEYQPSSNSAALRAIYMSTSSPNEGWCAGQNGTVMHTINGGGDVIPFVSVYPLYGIPCAGEPIWLNTQSGSVSSCSWTLDGAPFWGYCAASYTIDVSTLALGEHTLIMSATSPGGTGSDTLHFWLVDPPSVDLDLSSADTVLCHTGTTTINIGNSQTQVRYRCRNVTTGQLVGEVYGTGDPVQVQTSVIDSTCDLVIIAMSTLSDCQQTCQDTIHVRVEQTKAAFWSERVNAAVGEMFGMDQHCVDAQHFMWYFDGASMPTSMLADPADLSYPSPGTTMISLAAWSDNGCYDSIAVQGPYIYEESAPDSCWSMALNGIDGTSQATPCITDAKSTGTTMLVTGRSSQTLHLPSRIGQSVDLAADHGSFLASYTYAGVLRWVTHMSGPYQAEVNAVEPLPSGQIMVAGRFFPNCWLADNTGDSTLIPNMDINLENGFVALLDEQGRLLWVAQTLGLIPENIAEDHSGHFVVMGDLIGTGAYMQGGDTTHFYNTSTDRWTFLMKLSLDGSVVWSTYIESEYVNISQCFCADMAISPSGDIVLCGNYEHVNTFHSTNGGPSMTVDLNGGTFNGRMYVARYDSSGQVQWVIHSTESSIESVMRSVTVAPDGAIYATGDCDQDAFGTMLHLAHTDGSSYVESGVGHFIVLKLSPEGHPLWQNGSVAPIYGFGAGVFADESGVYAAGTYGGNGQAYLTSIGSPQVWCAAGGGDIFVVHYDNSGTLQHLYLPYSSLPNTGSIYPWLYEHDVPMFRVPDGSLFMISPFVSTTGAEYYGDTIYSTNDPNNGWDWDGMIVKLGINCYDFTTAAQTVNEGMDMPTIFPDPVVNEMHIQVPFLGPWTLTLFDPLGRMLVAPRKFNDQRVVLDIGSLSSQNSVMYAVLVQKGMRYTLPVMKLSR